MISGFKHIDHPIFLVHEHLIYFFGNLFEKEAELNTKELFHNDFLPVLEASNKLTTQFENLQKEYLQLCLADKYEIKHAFSLNNCTLSLSDLSIKPIKYDDLTNKVFAKLTSKLSVEGKASGSYQRTTLTGTFTSGTEV